MNFASIEFCLLRVDPEYPHDTRSGLKELPRTDLTEQFLARVPNSFTRTFSFNFFFRLAPNAYYSFSITIRWKGTQEGLVFFVVVSFTLLRLSSLVSERQFFVFPSLLRVLLRFVSFLLTATAKQHCVARYDLAVSCFLLTVLRHKIRCSGCCYWHCFTFPCLFRARSLSPLTSSYSRLAHVYTLAAACASAPRIRGSHSSLVTDHSLYFRGELFNILLD